MCNSNVYKYIIATLSVILAAVVGVLFYFAVIPNVADVIPAIGILSVGILAFIVLFLSIPKNKKVKKCLCDYGGIIALGSIGTIAFAIIVSAITIEVASILPTILIAVTAFFFILQLLGLLFFINCLLQKQCDNSSQCCCCCDVQATERINDCGF